MVIESTPRKDQAQHRSRLFWTRAFSLAVVFLALCIAGQAVHAKASHYSLKSPQALHFSTSVKIAKLAHHGSATLRAPAIMPGTYVLLGSQLSRAVVSLDLLPEKVSQPITSRLLRSPPETL